MDDITREIYTRQIMMDKIGETGQRTLADASVLVVGCGGLGSPVLYYLAGMGIGHLGLCDGDVVSLSNLNRQILYTMEDLGKKKTSAAHKRLNALNPELKITKYDQFLDEILAKSIVPSYDITVDCLDNFRTRFILNDACIAAGKPFVHAGIGEFYGQLMTVTPGKGPCLRCIFPDKFQNPDTEKPTGAVGVTPGVIGSLQALEVLKYLLGLPVSNEGLVMYDGLNMSLEKISIQISPECICNKGS